MVGAVVSIAVAGKYGFAITESDFKAMSENISDEELTAVTGGGTDWDGVGWNPAAKLPMTPEEAMEKGLLGPDGKLLPREKRLPTMKEIMAKML